jgi:hypothetical protein
MKRRKWPDLPPDVANHVEKTVSAINWESLLSDLMSACAGCPARNSDREPDPCQSCPVHAVTWSAARLWAAWKAQQENSDVKTFYDSLDDPKA